MVTQFSNEGIFGLLSIFGIIFLTGFLVWRWKRETTDRDVRFLHLNIDFSHVNDKFDTSEPSLPFYVTNIRTKQAYWVPPILYPYLKAHKVHCDSHKDENIAKACLKDQGVTVNDCYPENIEKLALWLLPNGLLARIEEDIDQAIIDKLTELKLKGKLKNYQIMFLFPWSCITHNSIIDNFPPDKTLLVDYSPELKNPKERPIARPFTNGSVTLFRKGLLLHDNYRKWLPNMPLSLCCKVYGFQFKRKPVDLYEFIDEEKLCRSKEFTLKEK